MVNLKDKTLNKKLRILEKEIIPSLEEIKKESKALEEKEISFKKKFMKKKLKK